jgi:hypothetical protein
LKKISDDRKLNLSILLLYRIDNRSVTSKDVADIEEQAQENIQNKFKKRNLILVKKMIRNPKNQTMVKMKTI